MAPAILVAFTLIALTGFGKPAAAQVPLVCLPGTLNYDPVLCAAQGGNSVFTPGLPAQVLVASSNTTCGAAVPATITVRNALGTPVTDGTPVVITTSLGAISPNQAGTVGGVVNAVLSAGGTPGTAVITAVAGGASGSTSVVITCVQAPLQFPVTGPIIIPSTAPQAVQAVPVAPAAVPATAAQPPAQPPRTSEVASVSEVASAISPPATGDAGLAAAQ